MNTLEDTTIHNINSQTLLNISGFGNVLPKNVAKIDPGEIKLVMNSGVPLELGRGGFGTVYKGHWNGKLVAIKYVQNRDEFSNEVRQLSRLNHKHIVTMYGVCDRKSWLVLELAETSLDDVLHGLVYGNRVEYTPGHAISWLKQCSEGLAFIHSKNLVYGDLKPSNLLLFNGGRTIKISDLGTITERKMVGTPAWIAPELIKLFNHYNKVDTYSFAILLWEVVSRQHPYSDGKQDVYTFLNNVILGNRPPIITDWPNQIKQLMTACWDQDPAKRPSMSDVSQYMANLSTLYPGGDIPLSNCHSTNKQQSENEVRKMRMQGS